MKREELVQVGVDIDAKDYLSTIISSLPVSLSSFVSAQLAAARMFSPTKSIEPDVLLSLLMEEADRQTAQLASHRVSKREKEEEPNEALSAGTGSSRPRKGRGRENIRCWNCEKMGHYSHECKEPKKTEEKAKDDEPKAQGTSASAVEPDTECEGAWAAESIEDAIEEGPGSALLISEMDWFEEAIAMMDAEKFVVPEEIPARDWFDEVAEGDDESRDEGASSGDVSVDGFDSDASEGAFVENLGITSQTWPVCNIYKEIDRSSSTLLGPCLFKVPVAPVVYHEGEYRGGGTTCVSSGRLPDLDVSEIPSFDNMKAWRTHDDALGTPENVGTLPLDNKGGGDDPAVQMHEGCCNELPRGLGPKIDHEICKSNPLVPRFEGEEDDQAETMDLPFVEGFCAQIKSPVTKIFDFALETMCESVIELPMNISNPLASFLKFFEGANTPQLEWVVPFVFFGRFEPFLAIGTYEKGQKVVEDVYGGGELTLEVGHLVWPPGFVFECRWMKNNALLIVVVDVCHMTLLILRLVSV